MAKKNSSNTIKQLVYSFGILAVVGVITLSFAAGIAYGEHVCAEREHAAIGEAE